MDQSNSTVDGVFSAIRTALITVGAALVSGGVLTKESPAIFWITFVSGSIMVIGPAIWGVVVAVQHALAVRQARAIGAQATLNMVAAGQALNANGDPIKVVSGTGDGGTPPLPVTEKTAAEIVKNFAPAVAPKAS